MKKNTVKNTMASEYKTREQWLIAGAELMSSWFSEVDAPEPKKLQFAVGFPKYCKPNAIGQCWDKIASEDKEHHNIFVSPVLADPVEVLGVVLHEQVHASVGVEHGHKKPFKDVVKKLGLAGKATATFVELDSPLHKRMLELVEKIGPYPHVKMALRRGKKRPPGGGWIKFVSTNNDKYILRLSPVAFKEAGAPMDPWGDEMQEAE